MFSHVTRSPQETGAVSTPFLQMWKLRPGTEEAPRLCRWRQGSGPGLTRLWLTTGLYITASR